MIVVTGANGFIGSALTTTLRNSNLPVQGICRSVSDGNRELMPIGNIDGKTDWGSALEGADTIIHLAARVHVVAKASDDTFRQFHRTNVEGTVRLAQEAVSRGVKRFIYLSSVKVNGDITSGNVFTEIDQPYPKGPYAVSKYNAEKELARLSENSEMEIVVIRPPLVYGPGVQANFLRLLEVVDKGIPLPLSLVHNNRSLIGITNLIDFILTCLRSTKAANQTFLISDDADISTPELIRKIAQRMGRRQILWQVPVSLVAAGLKLLGKTSVFDSLCGSLVVDISKSRQILGWKPVKSMDSELDDTVRWYLENKRGA